MLWHYLLLGIGCVLSSTHANIPNQAQTIDCDDESGDSSNTTIALSGPTKYVVETQKVTWHEAFVLCKQSNKELASIKSKDEEVALEKYLLTLKKPVDKLERYWIAGRRHGPSVGDFVWFNTGIPITYRQFTSGQPDNHNGKEACLELLHAGISHFYWNDYVCDITHKFICQ